MSHCDLFEASVKNCVDEFKLKVELIFFHSYLIELVDVKNKCFSCDIFNNEKLQRFHIKP